MFPRSIILNDFVLNSLMVKQTVAAFSTFFGKFIILVLPDEIVPGPFSIGLHCNTVDLSGFYRIFLKL